MLELLLGFTLLTVAIFALFAVFPTGDKAALRAVRMGQASEIARSIMEEELNKSYSSLIAEPSPRIGLRSSKGLSRRGKEMETTYSFEVKVTPDSTLKYCDIEVVVSWEEGSDLRVQSCKLESSKCELF